MQGIAYAATARGSRPPSDGGRVDGGAPLAGSPRPHRAPPGAARALMVAAACAAAMVAVYLVFAHLGSAERRDATLLHHFTNLDDSFIETNGHHLVHLLSPLLFTLWGVAIVSFGLARGRPRLALAAGLLMVVAPLSAEALKPLLAHPHVHIGHDSVGPASWPSGHSTAALTLVYSALLVTPPRLLRVAAVLGAAFALAVGLALLVLGMHMPSDVLGGYLLATLWGALALAAVRADERRANGARLAGGPGGVQAPGASGAPAGAQPS